MFPSAHASTTPPEEFLFRRDFLDSYHQGFRTKSSKRYIAYEDQKGCPVSLVIKSVNTKYHRERASTELFFRSNTQLTKSFCRCQTGTGYLRELPVLSLSVPVNITINVN